MDSRAARMTSPQLRALYERMEFRGLLRALDGERRRRRTHPARWSSRRRAASAPSPAIRTMPPDATHPPAVPRDYDDHHSRRRSFDAG